MLRSFGSSISQYFSWSISHELLEVLFRYFITDIDSNGTRYQRLHWGRHHSYLIVLVSHCHLLF